MTSDKIKHEVDSFMTRDQIAHEVDRFIALLNHIDHVSRDYALVCRVMRQAVLTHGGELRIDPALAEEARVERQLEFGGGVVRLGPPLVPPEKDDDR